MASAMEKSYDSLGNTSSDPTPGDLPTLLSSNAHTKRQSGQSKLSHRKILFVKNSHTSVGGISSEPLVTLKGSVSGPAEAIALDSTSANSAAETKGFVDGDHVEYYSKSYGEWIPGIISDVRPNVVCNCFMMMDRFSKIMQIPTACARRRNRLNRAMTINHSLTPSLKTAL